MLIVGLAVLIWFVCGAFARALVLGEFTRKWAWMSHKDIAWFMFLSGVVGLLIECIDSEKPLTLRWKHLSRSEREAIYAQENPLVYKIYGFTER